MSRVLELGVSVLLLVGICSGQVMYEEDEVVNGLDPRKFSDCQDARDGGYTKSGTFRLHMIKPVLNNTYKQSFHIHCEFTENNTFNVIQRRNDGSLNFNTFYSYYVNGFGHAAREYWLGLNRIQHLTATGNNRLDIQLKDWKYNSQNVMYTHFNLIGGRYTLNIGGYRGNIPDDMSFNNGMDFYTSDHSDVNQCAVQMSAGWWYSYCTYALLNGYHYIGGPYTPSGGYYNGIYWRDWLGYGYSLMSTQMMVSRN